MNTEGFWRSIIILISILTILFVLISQFILKDKKNKQKIQNILINIFLTIGIIYLFYRIYLIFPTEFINPTEFMLQSVINSIVNICVLSLATTGIVLIFKTSTTTNFAQGMIATFGAFVAAVLIQKFFTVNYPDLSNTLTVLLAMLGGAISAFILGVLIDVGIIRQSRDKSPVGKQMITMGLVLVFLGLMPLLFGTLPLPIPRLSYEPNISFELFNMSFYITTHALISLLITIVLLVVLFSALRFTKWGLGVRATASSEIVASMMGVNTRLITAMSWGIAGLLAAVSAVIFTPTMTNVGVSMMVSTQVNGFMAAILGSFSSFAGPLIASILIPILNGLLNFVVPLWQNAVVYVIILVIVLVKPMGLFGKIIAKKV